MTEPSKPTPVDITPNPTDEEAAAIVAAITMSWPSSAPVEDVEPDSTGWRFSGRWWHAARSWNR